MRWGHLILLAMLVVGLAVLGPGPGSSVGPVQAGQATVTIPGDYYAPAAIMIEVGQSVTWVNKDTDKHTAVTVPGAPEAFALPAYPGKAVSFKFTKPGVYVYYCQEHATFDPKSHRVLARKDADVYPIAMEGLIVVKGPGFVGAPSASVTIPGDSYDPYITVVRTGGKVTWINKDNERHMVTSMPGDPGPFDFTLFPGKSHTATFTTPGIYFYYCDLHATYNPKLGLAAAKKDADIFPASQQGYVVVL